MEENKETKTELIEEKKIGFEVYQPEVDAKGKKIKPKRFQDDLPYKGLRKATKIFTTIGVITSSLAIMYYFLPIFSAVVGSAVFLVFFMFGLISIVGSLGLAFLNDGYRDWISNHWFDVPFIFFNFTDYIAVLSPYFLIVGIPGVICSLVGLILSINLINKIRKHFVSYIVLNSIFLALSLLALLLFIISGGIIYNN